MAQKALLPIRQAIHDPRCPYGTERQVYNTIANAKPVTNTVGKVVSRGDPELLACFVRINGGSQGPIYVDLNRLERLMDKRRLGQSAAA
jgi:hypothetical protein